jgi:4-alpha-glucanotransferase
MSTATDMLAAYMAAEKAVLKGLSVRLGERQLTRANLPEIVAGRQEWEARVRAEKTNAFGGTDRYAVADFGGFR